MAQQPITTNTLQTVIDLSTFKLLISINSPFTNQTIITIHLNCTYFNLIQMQSYIVKFIFSGNHQISSLRQQNSTFLNIFQVKLEFESLIIQIMTQVSESGLFQKKLYQNFKDSGMLSKLKTTLRSTLLQKLQKPGSIDTEQNQQLQRSKPLHLRKKFLSNVILQHFKKLNYEYSYSIFSPESAMQQQDQLNYNEMAQIVNLNSAQYSPQGPKSFLQRLLQQWFNFRAQQVSERSCQTDFDDPLSKKLERIDKDYSQKIDYFKLVKYGNSLPQSQFQKQQEMKRKFNLEKAQIRTTLQLQIRRELQKKYDDQYQFKLREVQKAHEGRLSEIKNRQRMLLDSLQKKKVDIQQKARKLNEEQMKMIEKYDRLAKEVQVQFKRKLQQVQKKQREMWKKQLQLSAKRKQYEDSIRQVKQKIVQQSSI